MPPDFSILSGEDGFGVVVPDFSPAARRRATRTLWDAHVGGGSPFASISEFSQLLKAGEEKVWRQFSRADPDVWGQRWGEDGDREGGMNVVWYFDDDIPGRYTWEGS